MRCGLCPADAERRRGLPRCADCRPLALQAKRRVCPKCHVTHSSTRSWCASCNAEDMRLRYRRSQGIDAEVSAGPSCDECGSDLVAAANHRTVTMIRRYCSSACCNRAKCRRRRVARAGLPVERYAAADVFQRDGWVCRLCDEPVDRDARWPEGRCATIDHVLPVSLGGADVLDNVQTAHFSCNISKGNRVAS